MKKQYAVLWILFAVLVAVRVSVDMQYWIVTALETCGLAIALLFKAGKPSKKYTVIAVILAVLSTVAYLGYQRDPWILLYGLRAGIPTLLCTMAVFSVMEKKAAYALVSKKGKCALLISILIGVAVGVLLSVVNTYMSGLEISFDPSFWKVLTSLNPAIYEEMACRAIFMAFCIWYSDEEMKGFETFTMYFMMIIPHAVIHGYPLIETLVLGVVFGLPLTLLQRKRDITSAMVSHGIIDAVRFTLMGF